MPPVKSKTTKLRNRSASVPSRASPKVVPSAASEIASLPAPAVTALANHSTTRQAAHSPTLDAVNSAKPSPPSLTATEVADQLHSAAIHLLRRLRVRDREAKVGPAQLSALSVLVFGGPRSLGELADADQVRPPTMSRIVASLQGSGLVRRHATEDGRRVRLEATPKGVSLMWEARKRRVESLASAVERLPKDERQQLRDSLALLQQVMRNL
jgi:DNA-binding MarR family transcriptional regulator